jgi:hypothetical protein
MYKAGKSLGMFFMAGGFAMLVKADCRLDYPGLLSMLSNTPAAVCAKVLHAFAYAQTLRPK